MNKREQKHILIMPSWYKTPETPVLGTFFEEQARALVKEGYKVGIIYPEYSPAADIFSSAKGPSWDFYMDKGIPTFYIKPQKAIPKLRRLSYRNFSKAVDEVFQQYAETFGVPDLIHAHSVFHAGIAASYIAKTNKIPLVITEHLTAYLMGYITNKVDIEIARQVFEYADGAFIVSHNFRKDLEQQLELKEGTFSVIHNLVNDLFFENFSEKTYQPGETFRFFTNSFLLPRKNIHLIIEALRILKDEGLNVSLRIGGEGPLEKDLQDQIVKLELTNNVVLTGKLWRDEVKKEIDQSHCFVLASTYETFGVVLIESLACGRPVICTDSGGPRDFITAQQGIITAEHTAASLAESMKRMMQQYGQYNQSELSAYCKKHFSEHKIATEIKQFYDQVISKRLKYATR